MAKRLIRLEHVLIPADVWGDMWLFFEDHPGIQFKHQQPATPAPKGKRTHGKTSEGTTGTCIVLRALHESKTAMTPAQLTDIIEAAGKARATIGNVLHEQTKKKRLRRTKAGYLITPLGETFLNTKCANKE